MMHGAKRVTRTPGLIAASLVWLIAAPAVAKTQVSVAYSYDPGTEKIWASIEQAVEAANPDVDLQVIAVRTNFQDKIVAMASAGDLPDLWLDNSEREMAYFTAGIGADLTDLANRDQAFASDFFPTALDAFTYNGRLFGIPRHFQVTNVWYNKNLFDAAGLSYPDGSWTWGSFRDIAKKLTLDSNGDGSPEQWGVTLSLGPEFDLPYLYSAGGGIVDDLDHPTRGTLEASATLNAYRFLQAMIVEDRSAARDSDAFYAGKIGMYPYYAVAERMVDFAHFPYNAAGLPKGPAGSVNAIVPAGFMMSNTTKHPQEVWQVVKSLTSLATGMENAVPARLSLARTNNWPTVAVPADYNRRAFVDAALNAKSYMIKSPQIRQIFQLAGQMDKALTANTEALQVVAARVDPQIDALLETSG